MLHVAHWPSGLTRVGDLTYVACQGGLGVIDTVANRVDRVIPDAGGLGVAPYDIGEIVDVEGTVTAGGVPDRRLYVASGDSFAMVRPYLLDDVDRVTVPSGEASPSLWSVACVGAPPLLRRARHGSCAGCRRPGQQQDRRNHRAAARGGRHRRQPVRQLPVRSRICFTICSRSSTFPPDSPRSQQFPLRAVRMQWRCRATRVCSTSPATVAHRPVARDPRSSAASRWCCTPSGCGRRSKPAATPRRSPSLKTSAEPMWPTAMPARYRPLTSPVNRASSMR